MRACLLWFVLLCSPSLIHAAPWDGPRQLDALYERIGADLKAGRPLVIAAYYGLWFDQNAEPDRNLNWGTYYGNARMMKRATTDKHVRKLYQHWRWRLVHEQVGETDPLRTLVFHQRIKPTSSWRAAGVTEPFDAYLVMQAFSSREDAAVAVARNLRQSVDRRLTLPDGTVLDVGAAQAAGYVGHNLFYDYKGFEWDGFGGVPGEVESPKGVFAVGCKTGRVPGFHELVTENVFVLLFSRTLMAAEGYSTLALADALVGRLSSAQMVALGNRTYAYFQQLGRPERRVGKPFVSHGHGLYRKKKRAVRNAR